MKIVFVGWGKARVMGVDELFNAPAMGRDHAKSAYRCALQALDLLWFECNCLAYTTPCAIMAFATFMKPAMFAPFT